MSLEGILEAKCVPSFLPNVCKYLPNKRYSFKWVSFLFCLLFFCGTSNFFLVLLPRLKVFYYTMFIIVIFNPTIIPWPIPTSSLNPHYHLLNPIHHMIPQPPLPHHPSTPDPIPTSSPNLHHLPLNPNHHIILSPNYHIMLHFFNHLYHNCLWKK